MQNKINLQELEQHYRQTYGSKINLKLSVGDGSYASRVWERIQSVSQTVPMSASTIASSVESIDRELSHKGVSKKDHMDTIDYCINRPMMLEHAADLLKYLPGGSYVD